MSLSNLVRKHAPTVVQHIVFEFDRDRSGCVVCLVSAGGAQRKDLATAEPLIHELFVAEGREVRSDRVPSWQAFSRAEIAWTVMNESHVSSSQSVGQEPKRDSRGIVFTCGGVWYGLSMAGFEAKVAEAGAVALGVVMGMVNTEAVLAVQAASGNQHILPLLQNLLDVDYPHHSLLRSCVEGLAEKVH